MTDERDHDEHADEQERADAAALARALEGGPVKAPEAPLEAAALLRAVAAPAELSDDRAEQVLASLQPEVDRRLPAKRSRVIVWLAGATATGLAVAAGFFVYFSAHVERPDMGALSPPAVEVRSPLPAPRRELLAAQAALSAEDVAPEDRAAFEREMRAYRVTVLRKLKESYPTQVGLLEPGGAR